MVIKSDLMSELVAHSQDPAQLLEVFAAHGWSLSRFREANRTTSEDHPYSRKVLLSTPDCEVMLARWSPFATCSPHDHGASEGWVFCLEGDFHETAFAWNGQDLKVAGQTVHRQGSQIRVSDGEIHSCVTTVNGLSLHVYFPRIHRMRVFDRLGRRTLIVSDDCGAWIPNDPQQIIEEIPWRMSFDLTAY